jgi:hypothetical protein
VRNQDAAGLLSRPGSMRPVFSVLHRLIIIMYLCVTMDGWMDGWMDGLIEY